MFDTTHYPEGWEFREPRGRALSKRKPRYGVGINDAVYVVSPKINGRQLVCPFYIKWKNMLMRAYCLEFHKRCPTYIGCKVDQRWYSFMVFRKWFETSLGKTGLPVSEAQLDKDILGGGKLYSPKTCILVPSVLNNLMGTMSSSNSLPAGVCRQNNSYQALCMVGSKRLRKYSQDVNELADWYYETKRQVILDFDIPDWLPKRKVRAALLKQLDEICKRT